MTKKGHQIPFIWNKKIKVEKPVAFDIAIKLILGSPRNRWKCPWLIILNAATVVFSKS